MWGIPMRMPHIVFLFFFGCESSPPSLDLFANFARTIPPSFHLECHPPLFVPFPILSMAFFPPITIIHSHFYLPSKISRVVSLLNPGHQSRCHQRDTTVVATTKGHRCLWKEERCKFASGPTCDLLLLLGNYTWLAYLAPRSAQFMGSARARSPVLSLAEKHTPQGQGGHGM